MCKADMKLHPNQSRENSSESMKARVDTLVHDKLPCPILYNCKASRVMKQRRNRGNNSKSMKARIVILVRNTLL